MEKTGKILIIEDHEIVVWALTTLIEDRFPEMTVFSARTFENGLDILSKHRIGYVILDIDVPGGNSPKMIERIRAFQPAARILIHTSMPEEDYALRYLSAGADGFFSKTNPLGSLPDALRLLMEGKKYISEQTKQAIAENFFGDFDRQQKINTNTIFTSREKQVVHLLLKGKWTKEISEELGIKLSTVSTHKMTIFEKMQVTNAVDLFRKIQIQMPELLKGL